MDMAVILWNATSGESIGPLPVGHSSKVRSVAFQSNGSLLAAGSEDNTIKIWDLDTQTPIDSKDFLFDIYSVVFHPNGTLLAAGSQDNSIKLWNLNTNANKSLMGPNGDIFCCLRLSGEAPWLGRFLYCLRPNSYSGDAASLEICIMEQWKNREPKNLTMRRIQMK